MRIDLVVAQYFLRF